MKFNNKPFFDSIERNFNNFKYNKFNPSVNEWSNSKYSFASTWDNNNSNLFYNKITYTLMNSYFNMKFHMKKKFIYRKKLINRLSFLNMKRIFVSIPEFKHCLQNLSILIYIFNKEEILLLRKVKRLQNPVNTINKGYINSNISIVAKHKSIKSDNISNSRLFSINDRYIKIKNNLEVKSHSIFLYKLYLTRLYFNKFMFNFNNLFHLKKILYNIYKTEININIINLKYLYLDNSLYTDAMTRMLRDRKKNVLRVLRKALILPKIPILDNLITMHKSMNISIKEIKQQFILNTFNDLNSLKRNRISIYETMKNTHLVGLRLEGKGRLTRRLTAARAVYKIAYLGSLRNIVSSFQGYPTVVNKGFQNSNINYINVSSNNRNGAFGLKSWQNTM